MLTVEVRVNGSIVVALTAVRRSAVPDAAGLNTYEYQSVTFPIDNTGPLRTANGYLTHRAGNGIDDLAEKLIAAARYVK